MSFMVTNFESIVPFTSPTCKSIPSFNDDRAAHSCGYVEADTDHGGSGRYRSLFDRVLIASLTVKADSAEAPIPPFLSCFSMNALLQVKALGWLAEYFVHGDVTSPDEDL